MIKPKKSLTVVKFQNKLLRENRTFTKLLIIKTIPSEELVEKEGIIQYTKRVGGQLHQMYSLVDYEITGP